MNKSIARLVNFTMLSVLLPFVYGCQGGGGAASLFGGGGGDIVGGGGGDIVLGGGGIISGGVDGGIQTITNPEPATMLLFGTGLAAMAYFKVKGNRR